MVRDLRFATHIICTTQSLELKDKVWSFKIQYLYELHESAKQKHLFKKIIYKDEILKKENVYARRVMVPR